MNKNTMNIKACRATLTDNLGKKWTYTITWLRCILGEGWRVQGHDLDNFVPVGAVRFATHANVVNEAYETPNPFTA